MMDQFTEQIGAILAGQLAGFSFRNRGGRLSRATEIGWQAIVIEVLPTASKGIGKLAAHAQVRLEQIEALYTPHNPFLKPKDAKEHATLTRNCDSLLKDKALAPGFSLDQTSLDAFADAYAAALKTDVVPWLERYSDEEAVFEGLADSDPKNWITSDRLTRFPVLMAISARRGDTATFDAIASEFQEWCKQKHALVYTPLSSAMLRLRPTPDHPSSTPRG
jgi:hypothetical protein